MLRPLDYLSMMVLLVILLELPAGSSTKISRPGNQPRQNSDFSGLIEPDAFLRVRDRRGQQLGRTCQTSKPYRVLCYARTDPKLRLHLHLSTALFTVPTLEFYQKTLGLQSLPDKKSVWFSGLIEPDAFLRVQAGVGTAQDQTCKLLTVTLCYAETERY